MKLEKIKPETKFMGVLIVALVSFVLYDVALSAPALAPLKPRVTNVTDTSLTVSWQTALPEQGAVMISDQPNRWRRGLEFGVCRYFPFRCRIIADEAGGESRMHAVTISDLSPETPYFYRIISGGRWWRQDREGRLLPPIRTGPVLPALPWPHPVYSYVFQKQADQPVAGAVVYLTLVDGGEQSAVKSGTASVVTGKDGGWLVDLGNWRTPDNQATVLPGENDFYRAEVLADDGQQKIIYYPAGPERELEPVYLSR